ncbi:hypothetical protein GCM10009798_42280 [Nocardioides panacihumi]|uniref:Type 4 fimbrial biogenesis protein PilX N-terminal domain-containing protein n=1 Tax=Nocardioides panacihumi TaxID=400774 RepID=A0ABN2RXA3_9ACTN
MTARGIRRDDGAILVLAMIVVTTVTLVVGAVLTHGNGSLRATVALRQVAGTTYAADGAAQVAINDLRTGFNTGDAEPANWVFTNATGTGCFGYNADGSTVDGIALPAFYPPAKASGQGPTSAYVSCAAEDDTGEQGTAVPINSANKPGNAILTLGTGGETGFTFKTNGSSGAFRVRGGIWSDSDIVRDNNGVLQSSESIRAHTGCTPVAAMSAPVVDCSAATVPDPNYRSDLDIAATGIPALQTPPASCSSGSVTLQPGYYDDVTKLNALTPNGGSNCFIKLAPGTFYFDFHNNSADALQDDDIAGNVGDVWNVNSGTIVGGTLTSDTTIPGRCVNPIDDVSATGVQLLFGGDSRIVVDKGAAMEVCASYHADRPPIAIYGQKTGTATQTVLSGGSALTTSGTPTVTASTFTGATSANLQSADGNQATNANLAAWVRDGTGANSALPGSITMTGFAPTTALPKGTVVTGARLKITHRSTGAANVVTLTPNVGAGLSAYTLPARTTLGTEDIDLTARTGWGAFQRSVHDNGFTGAMLKFDASLRRNETSQLDAARLELTYYVPALRGETTAAVPGNTVATVGGSPVVKALGNNTLVYIQGTTYAPLASLDLSLNNIAESVFRFGVIARSLSIFETASFSYPGAVIELPDNSPGWGFNGTLVQLKVYLCPNSATCSAATGMLSLTSRVQVWDPTGTPVPNQRQIGVLSWSHRR